MRGPSPARPDGGPWPAAENSRSGVPESLGRFTVRDVEWLYEGRVPGRVVVHLEAVSLVGVGLLNGSDSEHPAA